jgi:predicted DNA binding CopG/RHH family protein
MAYYVKNQPGYEKVDYDREKVRAAALRLKKARKQPTSIALEPAVIHDLKRQAETRGLPYQVLMRMLIVEGLRKMKLTKVH